MQKNISDWFGLASFNNHSRRFTCEFYDSLGLIGRAFI